MTRQMRSKVRRVHCRVSLAERERRRAANKKELVTDLIVKAKQIDFLIQSLPEPDPEEKQVCVFAS